MLSVPPAERKRRIRLLAFSELFYRRGSQTHCRANAGKGIRCMVCMLPTAGAFHMYLMHGECVCARVKIADSSPPECEYVCNKVFDNAFADAKCGHCERAG